MNEARRVHLYPIPRSEEIGGISRAAMGQRRTLPAFGWEHVDDPEQADLIACHVEVPESYLRRFPDKPIVVHNHGLYWTEYDWPGAWHYDVNQRGLDAIRVAEITTAVSEWTAQALRRNSARDVRVVHHGVDLDEWRPPAAPGAYVLWNKTRVDPVCDPAPVDALAERMPDVRFVSTFSAGPARQNITLTGAQPFADAKALVRDAGVYLCTTRETFGIGTLEALACGVPVVGFRWGGQVEIVEHGVDGWLVTPGDIDGLAEGVRWAQEHRAELSAAARRKAEQFPESESGRRYAAIYDEAFERFHARRDGPRCSIVVTAYALDRYLPAALDSALAQTERNIEVIVVDDASPDRCGEIAEAYAARDPRVRVIHNAQNQYLAASRNIGIEAARGRYVLPLDADDQLAPRAVALLADALDADPRTHIAYGNVRFVEEDGETPVVYAEARRAGLAAGYSGWPLTFNLDRMLRGPGQLLPYASMFRREVWERLGGYRTRARSSEDQEFWLRASSYGFVPRYITKADTLIYRVREGSMSSAGGEGWEEHRAWFPWVGVRALIPAAAYQEGRPLDTLPMPALDPPAIAVVIPVGPGHGAYVVDAVDSVDAQTFRQWECIVVNDSGAPLPRLPSWVRVLCSDPACPCADGDPCHYAGADAWAGPPPRGVAAARNRGIAAARASRFLPLDADDYLQPEALDLMWRAHVQADGAIIYSDFWEDPETPGDFRVFTCPDWNGERLTSGLYYAVTALTPRAAWEAVGGYDESVAWEDWLFALATTAKGYCARRLAFPAFTYRKHTGRRRTESLADFERSRLGMMTAKIDVPTGGLAVACARCPQGRSSSMLMGARGAAVPPADGDAVLLSYQGQRAGNITFRSKARPGVTYVFSLSNRERYVLRADADVLLQRGDFTVADGGTVAAPPAPPVVAARTVAFPDAAPARSGTATLPPPPPPAEDAEAPPVTAEAPPAPATAPPAADAAAPDGEEDEAGLDEAIAALVRGHSREDLDQMARELSITDPELFKNKTEVAKVIHVARGMKAVI